MSETFELLGLLILFHLFGGIAAGASLRRGIRQGWSWALLRPFSRGLVFGGLPLFFGATELARREVWHLAWIEVLVFAGTFLVASLMPDWILELFDDQIFVPILIGGAFMLIGVIVFVTLAGDDVLEAFLVLAVFGGVGGLVFVTGALKVPRG